MSQVLPVAIFAYNRPRHVSQLFESLSKCARLDECTIYVYCDGPKVPEHIANVNASRQVVHEFASRLDNVRAVEREQNMGLAHSIVAGITELCAQYGRVIVLEDDFILHPTFLDFMLQSLDRYADDDRVAQIAGFTFAAKTTDPSVDSFFLPLVSAWGWATWKRAWDWFSWDLQSALTALNSDSELLARFNLNGAYPFYETLRNTANGKIDTWDIQWYWQTFHREKLTLYPRHSLVWQNGFDENATHTTAIWPGMQAPLEIFMQNQLHNPISFPASVESDRIAFESQKKIFARQWKRTPFSRLKGRLRRIYSRISEYF